MVSLDIGIERFASGLASGLISGLSVDLSLAMHGISGTVTANETILTPQRFCSYLRISYGPIYWCQSTNRVMAHFRKHQFVSYDVSTDEYNNRLVEDKPHFQYTDTIIWILKPSICLPTFSESTLNSERLCSGCDLFETKDRQWFSSVGIAH